MIEGIEHVALRVREEEKAIAFYRELLGFTPFSEQVMNKPDMEKIVFAKAGKDIIEFLVAPNASPSSKEDSSKEGLAHICFQVSGFDEEVEHWKSKGVEMITPPVPIQTSSGEGLKRVVFKGPNGESIELKGR